MKKIESFKVNHLNLQRGLYVSRRDVQQNVTVTTFDLRFTLPNAEPAMDTAALHTLEHLGATFLRNSAQADNVVYFGPMGCRTGFYLVMFGNLTSSDVYDLVVDMCRFILQFTGEIPGATAAECGNYLDQNLPMAQWYVKKFLDDLTQFRRFEYEN